MSARSQKMHRGQMAYDGFNEMFPQHGWMTVRVPSGRYWEVCCVDCLAVVAAKMGGRIVTTDDLVSATTKPKPAPRKRTPRTPLG